MSNKAKHLFIGCNQMTILHISDLHLFSDGEQSLLGVNTHESFRAVLDDAKLRGVDPDQIGRAHV